MNIHGRMGRCWRGTKSISCRFEQTTVSIVGITGSAYRDREGGHHDPSAQALSKRSGRVAVLDIVVGAHAGSVDVVSFLVAVLVAELVASNIVVVFASAIVMDSFCSLNILVFADNSR